MRTRRTPFYGDPEDAALLGSMGDGSDLALPDVYAELDEIARKPDSFAEFEPPKHPNYREIGAEVPLGFIGHQGENRTQRRAAAATWTPPVLPEGEQPPTRRALWAQRQRQRLGKLDPELRRLQRSRVEGKR